MQGIEKLIISSDEDAFKVLEELIEGTQKGNIDLELSNWPKVNLYLNGEKYHQTMTPSSMNAMLELHKSFKRAFADAKYGNSSRVLPEEELALLEFEVEVKDGSSDLNVDVAPIVNAFAEKVATMDPQTLLILLLGLGLIWASKASIALLANNRKEIRLAELSEKTTSKLIESRKDDLTAFDALAGVSKKQLEVLQSAIESQPLLKTAQESFSDTHLEMVKAASTADEARINGLDIPQHIAQELRTGARQAKETEIITAVMLVKKMEQIPGGQRLRFVHVDNIESAVNAKLDMSPEEDHLGNIVNKSNVKTLKLINEAFMTEKPIEMELDVVYSKGQIIKADVLSANLEFD